MESEEEFVAISCLLIEEERIKCRKRRFWVHNINRKILMFDEYYTLFPDLVEDDAKNSGPHLILIPSPGLSVEWQNDGESVGGGTDVFCLTNDLDFLSTRIYIGLWMGIIALVISSFEGSVFVKLFTRFTEEIFAALIALLYMVDSFTKVYQVFKKYPLLYDYCSPSGIANTTETFSNMEWYSGDSELEMLSLDQDFNYTTTISSVDQSNSSFQMRAEIVDSFVQPNTALFCFILSLGTFFIAYYLRQFRNSKFLGRNARRALGDFGVPIAIVVMVMIDYLVPSVYTEKLKVPEGLSPSSPNERGWLIVPAISQAWVPFAAIFPAMLVYILLFMETHICDALFAERVTLVGAGISLLVTDWNFTCPISGLPRLSSISGLPRLLPSRDFPVFFHLGTSPSSPISGLPRPAFTLTCTFPSLTPSSTRLHRMPPATSVALDERFTVLTRRKPKSVNSNMAEDPSTHCSLARNLITGCKSLAYDLSLKLIVSKKERKLKKGSGFHLDIVIVSLMNIMCGFMGTPWMCAATVRSIAHVSAITVMSRTHAPGERPYIIEVKGGDTIVTALFVESVNN
uniref:Bicarbonate transporter-like transmembrane domain-containing protein n=1 Tax=Timema tahoe TaxID=61484 RepID=A0A7R9IKK6_9NEOP|nr:unnamed protein product [Timema tahoe]